VAAASRGYWAEPAADGARSAGVFTAALVLAAALTPAGAGADRLRAAGNSHTPRLAAPNRSFRG
jgi:hypothetical protein